MTTSLTVASLAFVQVDDGPAAFNLILWKMDHIELPEDQKLVDLALSPATLDVAQDVLEAAPELTTDIVLFIEPNQLPPSIQNGIVELASNPARPGSFKLLSPNEDINVARLNSDQGAWLIRYEQDESLKEGQFIIDPVVANDMGKSEDLRHGRLDILVRFKRPCEAFRALGHILASTRYAVTLSTVPSMQGDEAFSSPPPPTSDDEPMSTSSSTSSTGSRSRALGKVLTLLERDETANFETLGALVDVSRNGVLRVDSVKFFLRQQALIGCNLLHLYTEFVVSFFSLQSCFRVSSTAGTTRLLVERLLVDASLICSELNLVFRVIATGKPMPFRLNHSSATLEVLTPSKSFARLTTMHTTSA